MLQAKSYFWYFGFCTKLFILEFNVLLNQYFIHHAAYFLNPSCYYSKNFSNHEEGTLRLQKSLETMVKSKHKQIDILNQVGSVQLIIIILVYEVLVIGY